MKINKNIFFYLYIILRVGTDWVPPSPDPLVLFITDLFLPHILALISHECLEF